MSRNGSGVYNLPTNSWNPAIVGVSATPADWQALINDVAAALTQSLSADGQTPLSGNLNMAGNKLTGLAAGTATGDSVRWQQLFSLGQPLDIASAATTDIGAQNTTILNVTGTTTITSFGANYNGPRFLRFADVLILTHGASLVLPTSANITTAAGDSAIVVPNGTPASGWRVVAYQRANGSPLAVATNAETQTGTDTVRAVTPAGLASVTSTDTRRGLIELATTAEAQAGTDTERAITPARLRDALNASGSAPIYACRAWVNFNGTGTVAIRASGNVSSITDNGTGIYTVNFTTAMPDANYVTSGALFSVAFSQAMGIGGSKTPSSVTLVTGTSVATDFSEVSAAFFR